MEMCQYQVVGEFPEKRQEQSVSSGESHSSQSKLTPSVAKTPRTPGGRRKQVEWGRWMKVASHELADDEGIETQQQHCANFAGPDIVLSYASDSQVSLLARCRTHVGCHWTVRGDDVDGLFTLFWNQEGHATSVPKRRGTASVVPPKNSKMEKSGSHLIHRKSSFGLSNRTASGIADTQRRPMPIIVPDTNDGEDVMKRGVEDLPDLTDRLISYGLYDKYKTFRQGYMQWRTGGPQGATGEHTAAGLNALDDNKQFDNWYPTFKAWQWRRTASYWIAITGLEATVTYFFGQTVWFFPDIWTSFIPLDLVPKTQFVAGVLWVIQAYFMCFEVINLKRPDTQKSYKNPFAFTRTQDNFDALGIPLNSYWISMGTLIAASISLLGQVTKNGYYFAGADEAAYPWMRATNIIMWAAFVVNMYICCLVCKENDVLEHFAYGVLNDLAVWCCIISFIGNCLGVISATIKMICCWGIIVGYEYTAECYFEGALFCLMLTAIISLILWRDEQFGLTYLAALNKISSTGQQRFVRLSVARRKSLAKSKTGENILPTPEQVAELQRKVQEERDAEQEETGDSIEESERVSLIPDQENQFKEDREKEEKKKYSEFLLSMNTQNIIVISGIVTFAGAAWFSIFMTLDLPEKITTKLLACSSQVLICTLLHVVLMVKSFMIEIPTAQPLRFMAQSLHWVALFVGIHSVLTFLNCYVEYFSSYTDTGSTPV